jgi:hypothetical protein
MNQISVDASLTLRIGAMEADRNIVRPTCAIRRLPLYVMAGFTGTLLLAASYTGRAAESACKAVQAAVELQSKAPFHATVTGTPTRAGTPAAAKSEMIWIGNTLYLSMGGRWVGGPMPPERALVGVTGGNLPFSDCARLPDATVSGQPTSVFSAKMQSGESVQLFISASGQLLRDILDQHVMTVTVDFEYANVRAPALSK